MVWNLVHCDSLSKQESFGEMKLSIISFCGHRGVETTEGFAHIAMETVVHGSVDETNPSLLPPLFLCYFKTWCSSVYPQGFAITSTVTHEPKQT